MRRSIILITLAVIAALASSGKDRLYIESFNIAAGQTLQIPVLLLNDTAYSGLQTDLYLPEGLSLDMNDNDEYIIDLTSRRDKSHTVASRRLDDGAIRIYVTSVSTREFLGNSGAIMTLSITAASGFNGAAVIALRNSVADEICEVNAGMKFDVNGDGEINIADINVITDIILGGTVDELTRRRADVNGDGEINIADINTVTDAILSK